MRAPDAPFAGKAALITGASRGIGRSTALRLAALGADLILVARSADALATVLRDAGGRGTLLTADLEVPESLNGVVASVTEFLGDRNMTAPDIVVNNAGAFLVAPFAETSAEELRRHMEVNLHAPFVLTRAFLGAMLLRGSGHIVTVGSVADRAIYPGNAAYASTKYALRALHEVLRAESRGSGVRATLVSPGPVDTRLWDPVDPDNSAGFTPRAEMLDPESVADAIVYAVTRPAHVDVEELRISRS